MKRLLTAFVVIALAFMCMPVDTVAQVDTVYLGPTPAGSLNNFINGDTLAGGVRAHPDRVYKLRHGVVYQVTEPMRINGNITIIANDTTAGIRPPVLAPGILPDNSSIDHFFDFIGLGSKIQISDLYITCQRSDNNWLGWPNIMNIRADSVSLKLRGMIHDGCAGTGISPAPWMKLDVRDSKFRNHQHTGAWFGGQPYSGGSGPYDSVSFINNSYIANNSYSYIPWGYSNYSNFEHNTMMYGAVNPFLDRTAIRSRVKNNILYAMHGMGGNPDHIINSWFLNSPDTATSTIIEFRHEDSTSYWARLYWSAANNKPNYWRGPQVHVDSARGVLPDMLDSDKRTYDVTNNLFFWPQKLVDFYKAYNDTVATFDSVDTPVYEVGVQKMYWKRTLTQPKWLNGSGRFYADSVNALFGNVKIEEALNVDPGFPAVVTGHIDSLIDYVHQITTGTIGSNRWAYPDNNLYPVEWPLPEDMAYTNAALMTAGSDGFPLGDLNWFPDKKREWEQLTDVKLVESVIPLEYALSQNYPNPFNPSTAIEFSLPKASKVTLTVYNMLGQEVATLVSATLGAGRYTTQFDGSKLSSGTYVYRLTADNFVKASKMMLVK